MTINLIDVIFADGEHITPQQVVIRLTGLAKATVAVPKTKQYLNEQIDTNLFIQY